MGILAAVVRVLLSEHWQMQRQVSVRQKSRAVRVLLRLRHVVRFQHLKEAFLKKKIVQSPAYANKYKKNKHF